MWLLYAQRMSTLLSSWCMIAVEVKPGDVLCTKKSVAWTTTGCCGRRSVIFSVVTVVVMGVLIRGNRSSSICCCKLVELFLFEMLVANGCAKDLDLLSFVH